MKYKIKNEFKEKEPKEEQGDTAALIALIFVHPSHRLGDIGHRSGPSQALVRVLSDG
jgi:hypothetical protein